MKRGGYIYILYERTLTLSNMVLFKAEAARSRVLMIEQGGSIFRTMPPPVTRQHHHV